MQARSQTLGDEHPSTTKARNDLAVVYASTDRKEDALRVFLEQLEIQRRVLG